jgi:hypothetical protein
MTSTTQRNDPEEVRKELLATIHASRELGPDMDDTLTDRFIERLGALRPAGSFDPAPARAELRSLLQTARGSGADGDNALAEQFIAGLRAPAPPALPAYAPYGGVPAPAPYGSYGPGPMGPYQGGGFTQIAPMIICATIFIVALIVSHGELWWLFWLLPASFGWSRRGRYERDQRRRLYRDQRNAYRQNRVLGRDEVYPPLPPQQRPPEIL